MRSRSFYFLLIVFIFLLPVCAFAQPNDLNMEGLAGRVKSIEEETAVKKEKNGVLVEGSRNRTHTIIFDKQGRMTYEWVKIKELTPREFYYTYEKNNRRITRSIYLDPFSDNSKPPREQLSASVLTFDRGERILYRDVYIGTISNINPSAGELNIPTQKYKYLFDKDNRLLAKVMLTLKGEEASMDKYVYGPGRLPVERRLSMFGDPRLQVIKYTYELDARGNWIKQTEENTWGDAKATKEWKVSYRKISYYKN